MSWEDTLKTKYPKTCYNIYCGACDLDDWNPYIELALFQIETLVKEGQCQIAQIKEKFGGLRLYYDDHDLTGPQRNLIDRIITQAEIDCIRL